VLDGDGLTLNGLKIDGEALLPSAIRSRRTSIIAQPPQRPFELEIETLVDPTANTH
jgi:aminopeptidase N